MCMTDPASGRLSLVVVHDCPWKRGGGSINYGEAREGVTLGAGGTGSLHSPVITAGVWSTSLALAAWPWSWPWLRARLGQWLWDTTSLQDSEKNKNNLG